MPCRAFVRLHETVKARVCACLCPGGLGRGEEVTAGFSALSVLVAPVCLVRERLLLLVRTDPCQQEMEQSQWRLVLINPKR